MIDQKKWMKIIFTIGVIATIIGAFDPMEGSIVILAGSLLLSFATFKTGDRHWKLFVVASTLIAIGVFFLFYLSSLGGFGGDTQRSWWWGLLIIPYPLGWMFTLILLVLRSLRKKASDADAGGS